MDDGQHADKSVRRVRAGVLAAGRGLRMGGKKAKTLLPVGEQEPLIQYILEGLTRAGIERLLVVTGFRASEVEAYVEAHAGGLQVTFVRNARYATWGNFHSVRLALEQSPDDDVLVVNSDVIVNPDVYQRVATTGGDLVLAVEQRGQLDEEDMRVQVEDGRLKAIGKNLDMAVSYGEYTGVSLVRPRTARLYTDLCTRLEWEGRTALYYEDVYAPLLRSVDGRAVIVGPGEYAEVDSPKDVPAAEAVIARNPHWWGTPRAEGSS